MSTLSWNAPTQVIDHSGNTIPCAVNDDKQGLINAVNTGIYMLVSWVDSTTQPQAFLYNFMDGKADHGVGTVSTDAMNFGSNFFPNYMNQRNYLSAIMTENSGTQTHLLSYEPDSDWNWTSNSITLPTGVGNIDRVVQAAGQAYLIGVEASLTTGSNSVMETYLTVSTYNMLSKEVNLVASTPFSTVGLPTAPFAVAGYADADAQPNFLFTFIDSTDDDKFKSFTLSVENFTTPQNQLEVSQTSTMCPTLVPNDDGTILSVYTGSNQKLYSLSYDIATNSWGDSTEISGTENMHSSYNPAVSNSALGMVIFYAATDGTVYSVSEDVVVPANNDNSEEATEEPPDSTGTNDDSEE